MPPMGKKKQVNSPSGAYDRQAKNWALIHDLRGGTLAMRDAGEKWLPREPEETVSQYENRLNRSVLFNGYADTTSRLASKPFAKPVNVEEAPPELEGFSDNVDGMGSDITSFAGDLMLSAIDYGLTHIFVDFTNVPEGANLADERSIGARPHFIHVAPPNLLEAKSEVLGGVQTLIRVRVREYEVEETDDYRDEEVEYTRVITAPTVGPNPVVDIRQGEKDVLPEKTVVLENAEGLGTWERWRKDPETGEVTLESYGTHTFPGIPWVTVYTNQTGFMEGRPAMEDLAWMNLIHWQSLSDHRNILRFARVGLLFASGFSGEEYERGFVIGPGRVIKAKSPDANLRYVEYGGGAITAGQNDLKDTEEAMEVLGMQPLVRRSGGQTATGKAIDEANSQSDMQAWIRRLERALGDAYGMAYQWIRSGGAMPESFKVNIFNDFGISERTADDLATLRNMRIDGDISYETYFREIKRRGIISEDIDSEAEKERIENERPKGLVDDLDPDPDPDDPESMTDRTEKPDE